MNVNFVCSPLTFLQVQLSHWSSRSFRSPQPDGGRFRVFLLIRCAGWECKAFLCGTPFRFDLPVVEYVPC